MKKSVRFLLILLLSCLLVGLLWLGWRWYDSHVDRSGWKTVNGTTIYADFYGDPVTGWQTIDGKRYYFAPDHSLHTGWLTTDAGTFYLNGDGTLHTDWLDTSDGRYYFGPDGLLCRFWQTVDGTRYYFDGEGLLQSGWIQWNGSRYYLLSSGTPGSGWQQTPEGTCYLREDGRPITGWHTLENDLYCFDPEGFLCAGWQEWEGERYYLSETGQAHSGWLTVDGSRYYFDDHHAMVTGWQTINGSRYFFEDSGIMHTGWLRQGEYRYYLLPHGSAATGKLELDGQTHYFTPQGIWVLLVNPWHPLPDDYPLELVELADGFQVDAQCADALSSMMDAMEEAGLLPMFSSAYRTKAHQSGIWQSYVNQYMASGYSAAQANAMTARYVAVPGTSEHHTGLAVDIVGYDYFYSGHYGSTMAVQAWLAEHCWEYGFILRYTEEKQSITGFAPETWHFRYVGTLVSLDMKDSGLCLEEYLGATQK